VLRVGAMQLSQPQAGDALPLWAQGLLPGGGLWTDAKRLADHDHSGGLNGKPVAGAGGGVTSVNGATGDVVLTAADVGAPTQAAFTALTNRVAALEASLVVLRTHTHLLGTIDAGTIGPTQVIP